LVFTGPPFESETVIQSTIIDHDYHSLNLDG